MSLSYPNFRAFYGEFSPPATGGVTGVRQKRD
jgi:hypothetical protein